MGGRVGGAEKGHQRETRLCDANAEELGCSVDGVGMELLGTLLEQENVCGPQGLGALVGGATSPPLLCASIR